MKIYKKKLYAEYIPGIGYMNEFDKAVMLDRLPYEGDIEYKGYALDLMGNDSDTPRLVHDCPLYHAKHGGMGVDEYFFITDRPVTEELWDEIIHLLGGTYIKHDDPPFTYSLEPGTFYIKYHDDYIQYRIKHPGGGAWWTSNKPNKSLVMIYDLDNHEELELEYDI